MRRCTTWGLVAVFALFWGCDDTGSPGGGTLDGGQDGGTGFDSGGHGGTGGSAGMGGEGGSAGAGGEGGSAGTGGAGGEGGQDMGVEPDMGPPLPTLCEACETDDDCDEGGRCIELRDGKRCGTHCETDEDCEDGYGCQPVEGEDDSQCAPFSGSCDACEDADHDGYGDGPGCIAADCAPNDPMIHPGVESDPCDGVDNDCDGQIDEDFEVEACGVGACAAESACVDGVVQDCTPGAAADADVVCDGIDEDCDGNVDEDYAPIACGMGVCAAESSCADGEEQDCVPGDPLSDDDATCDATDDNCNGEDDEDYVGPECGVGVCVAAGTCLAGQAICEPGPQLTPTDATCDGIDDNCNSATDEDWVSDATCGVGACVRDHECQDGEDTCEPGEPLTVNDATCDNVDDDCDGDVDEDCNENFLGFGVNDQGADFIDVDISYEQVVGAAGDPTQSLPRLVDITVIYPDPIDLRQPDLEGVIKGQALIDAEKDLTIVRESPTRVRVMASNPGNSNRIQPGVLFTLRFTHAGGGPFHFEFDPVFSVFSPEEARASLTFRSADL